MTALFESRQVATLDATSSQTAGAWAVAAYGGGLETNDTSEKSGKEFKPADGSCHMDVEMTDTAQQASRGKANKNSAVMTMCQGGKVAGSRGSDNGSPQVAQSDEKHGSAGDTANANVDFVTDRPKSGRTFAALMAVSGADQDILHNANVDMVVLKSVTVSGVEWSSSSMDACGSSWDHNDELMSTCIPKALVALGSEKDGATRGGTTLKAWRRAEVACSGAESVATSDGRTLYLTPTESSLDEGTGISPKKQKGSPRHGVRAI